MLINFTVTEEWARTPTPKTVVYLEYTDTGLFFSAHLTRLPEHLVLVQNDINLGKFES